MTLPLMASALAFLSSARADVPAALDHFWPSFPTLSQMQPHFFWLPVLLLSLQYGTVSGLLAAGVAIVLTAWLGWAEQEVGENHFNYLLRISTQPMLWLVAALLLGQFRLRQIEQAGWQLLGMIEQMLARVDGGVTTTSAPARLPASPAPTASAD